MKMKVVGMDRTARTLQSWVRWMGRLMKALIRQAVKQQIMEEGKDAVDREEAKKILDKITLEEVIELCSGQGKPGDVGQTS